MFPVVATDSSQMILKQKMVTSNTNSLMWSYKLFLYPTDNITKELLPTCLVASDDAFHKTLKTY